VGLEPGSPSDLILLDDIRQVERKITEKEKELVPLSAKLRGAGEELFLAVTNWSASLDHLGHREKGLRVTGVGVWG
jgi:hypothetical protein